MHCEANVFLNAWQDKPVAMDGLTGHMQDCMPWCILFVYDIGIKRGVNDKLEKWRKSATS